MRVILVLLALVLAPRMAAADELRLLASVAMKGALERLLPAFYARSGTGVTVQYGTGAAIGKLINDGAPFDVTVATAGQVDQLVASGIVLAAPRPVVGTAVASLAYRSGTAPPDVATEAAFKTTMLAATTISTSDPANGGASAGYFRALCQRLGLTEAVAPKLVLTKPGEGAAPVAAGTALYGVALSSEIAAVPGTSGVPILPADPAGRTVLEAAVAAKSSAPDAARALIAYLTSPDMRAVRLTAGFE